MFFTLFFSSYNASQFTVSKNFAHITWLMLPGPCELDTVTFLSEKRKLKLRLSILPKVIGQGGDRGKKTPQVF